MNKKLYIITFFLFLLFFQLAVAQKPMPNRTGLEIKINREVPSFINGGMRLSNETRRPLTVYNANFGVKPAAPEAMAIQYLTANLNLLGLTPQDLQNLKLHAVRKSEAGTTIRLRQFWQNLPVLGSEITITISPQHIVTMVMNGFSYGIKLKDITPGLTSRQARQLVTSHLRAKGNALTEKVELCLFQYQQKTALYYRVNLQLEDPIGDWEALVDAKTGNLLKVEDIACYYHQRKKGRNHAPGLPRMPFTTVNGTGNVFDPEPISSANAMYGNTGFVDGSDANTAELTTQLQSKTLLDISFDGTNYNLDGPYAKIIDFESPSNGLFSQNTPTWNFDRSADAFEAANAYYHIDASMRYINLTLGLNIMPYQYTGGVRFDPSGLNGVDNSHYLGSSGQLAFGEGGVDDAEDCGVILHELGHGLHDWVTSGGLSQVNGLSEGCGDYWTASYNRSKGNWTATQAPYNWTFIWDGHNPFWQGRIVNYSGVYSAGMTGEIHVVGQIWATAMMQVWDAVGKTKADKAFWNGLGMTNSSSNQNDAANAVYQAAVALGFTFPELQQIHAIFTNRGYTLPLPPVCPTITVTNPAVSTGTTGMAFSQAFTSSGGVPTITYTTVSTLPTGLTLSSAGVLSGTPSQFGAFPVIVTATDANGCAGTGGTYSLTINSTGPIITSFSPAMAGAGDTVIVKGKYLIGATAVSFGGVAATSFAIVNDSVVTAIVAQAGASGNVSVTTPIGTATKGGFFFDEPPGNAIQLDGSTQYVLANTGTATISGSFTAEAWVRPATTGTLNILSTRGPLEAGFDMKLMGGNKIHADIGDGSNWLTTNADADFTYTAGTWYHIAYVVTSGRYTIYASGDSVGGGTFSGTPLLVNASHNITIGTLANYAEYFNGNIDEVRVYDTALDKASIRADMRSTAISLPAHLQLYYNFDQSTGVDTITDYSGHNYTGTINGIVPYPFVESYAMVVPTGKKATNVTDISFTANWSPPTTGTFDNYFLDVATDSLFTSILPGYHQLLVIDTLQNVTGLTKGVKYFYRVRANKTSLQGQGAYSPRWSVTTIAPPTISSFTPGRAGAGMTITITGTGFTGATAVSFGGTAAASFQVISATSIQAVIGSGASGSVKVTTPAGTAAKTGFVYCNAVTPSVAITADIASPICAKTKVIFTAATVGGGTPVYQWYKNKIAVGTNSEKYVDSLITNNSNIWCVITSTASCRTADTAKSNVMKYLVNPVLTPTLNVAINTTTTICAGTPVTFTATAKNTGANPQYQWKKNNVNVGTNSPVYIDNALNNKDSVICVLTITAPCATTASITSKRIRFAVKSVPARPSAITGSSIVASGQTGLIYSITPVAGVTYSWVVPDSAIIVSGQGTASITVNWGSTSGTIRVTANNACGASAARQLAVTVSSGLVSYNLKNSSATNSYVRIYPNPVTSVLTMEFSASNVHKYEAQVVNSLGQVLTSKSSLTVKGVNRVSFDMTNYPSAMYYIKLLDTEHKSSMLKVIKSK